ncbi:MAG: HNH endonuclease [Bdellovibrionales bacterium]|nr:HNH endonuclease [Bdellovibrionales bacterium]
MMQEKLNLLRQVSDEDILINTEKIIQEERRLTAELLQHLREIDRRMIYAKMGYPSLYDFLVRRFSYSSGAAYRRIATMRLIRDVPEVELKVSSGSISLSSAAKVQTFFRDIKSENSIQLSNTEKREIISQVENKSVREVDKILLHLSPNSVPKDRQRQITDDLTEIKFIADSVLLTKLDKIRLLISGKIPRASYREVINEASDIAISKLDRTANRGSSHRPSKNFVQIASKNLFHGTSKNLVQGASKNLFEAGEENSIQASGGTSDRSKELRHAKPTSGILCVKSTSEKVPDAQGTICEETSSNLPRHELTHSGIAQPEKTQSEKLQPEYKICRPYISTHLKAEVWRKCEAKCSFKAKGDSKPCGSRYRLEVDHIVPVAKGGKTEIENLRLLCQTHNLYEAKRLFGLEHMSKHVNKFL